MLGQDDVPLISALICTRNRGGLIVDTVTSILANTHPNFELVIIDQSTNEETVNALRSFGVDQRLKHCRSSTAGKGHALNVGLSETQGKVIAITDDDCVVPLDWLEKFASIFDSFPDVAVAFCGVEAGEHDSKAGVVPDFVCVSDKMLTSTRDARDVRGLGAGIAVRRNMIEKMGGFDPMLGPGSKFPDCDDRDIAIRALLANYHVYQTSAMNVKHFGFRTWQQARQLTRRNFLGIGASYSKLLRCGRRDLMFIPAHEFIKFALWPPFRDVLTLRQPRGIVRITAFLAGFVAGLRTPIDKATMIFIDE